MILIKIQEGSPINREEWNNLCHKNGNLYQSTYSDNIFSFYNNKAIYFHAFIDDKLIAGVKLYRYESYKLPRYIRSISRQGSIFGEPVYDIFDKKQKAEIELFLTKKIEDYIYLSSFTTVVLNSLYGYTNKLKFKVKEKISRSFNIAYIDLTLNLDIILNNMHGKHRNMIRRAEREKLIFKEEKDFSIFEKLLIETYKYNTGSMPNVNYIRNLYNHLNPLELVKLFVVYDINKQPLSSALVEYFGNSAYYSFAGNKRNSLGSGQYLQWNIIKIMKELNIEKYYLGQVAGQVDASNIKFSKNITSFKTRFGVEQIKADKTLYILDKFKYRLWLYLVKLLNAIKL